MYGKKPSKNLLLWYQWTVFHETCYVASGTPAHHSLYKWWPYADLDLFHDKVKFCNLKEKVKTVDFSETNAACGLKVVDADNSLSK